MATKPRIQKDDVLVVGRLSESFYTQADDLLNLVIAELKLPDVIDGNLQSDTLDDRYVMKRGDTMGGALITVAPTQGNHAANRTFVETEVNGLAQGQVSTNTQAISSLDTKLSQEISGVDTALTNEVTRATNSENAIDQRIDNLNLSDLKDTNLAQDPAEDEVLTWSAGAWQAKAVKIDGGLKNLGFTDLTQEAPAARPDDFGGGPFEVGDFFINKAESSGTIDDSWTGIAGEEADGSEVVVVSSVTRGLSWEIGGSVGGGGLELSDLNATSIAPVDGQEATLTYNNQNGVFTLQRPDLTHLIPKNIETLPSLP